MVVSQAETSAAYDRTRITILRSATSSTVRLIYLPSLEISVTLRRSNFQHTRTVQHCLIFATLFLEANTIEIVNRVAGQPYTFSVLFQIISWLITRALPYIVHSYKYSEAV